MKALPLAIFFLILATSATIAGCTNMASDTDTAKMQSAAKEIAVSVNNGLLDLKSGLKNTSFALSTPTLSGRETGDILSDNFRHYPWAISSLAIAKNGTVMSAVPGNYLVVVGLDMSGREQIQKANTAKAPLVSGVFTMVEGYHGISQSYPIFSPAGEYLGYTDITYAPEVFLARHIEPVTRGTPYDAWVVQTDGTEIYDTTKEEIGKNILTDPAYADPAVKQIAARIVQEPSGSGKYTFRDREWNRNVTKTAVWETAGIDGAVWRVVVTKSDAQTGVNTPVMTAAANETTGARFENLTRFVEKAAAYAKEHGKEAALKEYNDLNGTFTSGDQYIFAYTMNSTVLALPYQQGLIGTGRAGVTDENGVKMIDRMADLAREGGGSVYYLYPNPADNYREEFKVAYVLPVDDEWFVGSGIYLPGMPAGFNATERDALVDRVNQAIRYAQVHGAGSALDRFTNKSSEFTDGRNYLFAYGMNGTVLAHPYQPELIGTNRLNYTDRYGITVQDWVAAEAKRGGGFMYLEYLNPDTGASELKLCYVAPVNEEWLVGSGIYAGQF